jgi:hypothetical protein
LPAREYSLAVVELKKAIELYPDLLLAYISLSQAYTHAGQLDLARRADASYQAEMAKQNRASANAGYKPTPWR